MARIPGRSSEQAKRGRVRHEKSAKGRQEVPKVSTLALPSDDLNQQIITMLEKDGRLPYDVISERLGISAGTVRNRVNRMREAGMLSIVAVVDPVAVDYVADAMLGIKVAPGTAPRELAERLAAHSEVVYILWVSGRYDLLVELVCDAEDTLNDFLEKHIHKATDIASAEVMGSIAMFKNQFLLKRHTP